VLLAVFADIHANWEAFSACLDVARVRGAEQIILLGDTLDMAPIRNGRSM
jgi:predicted phosphodiesterase